MQVLQTRQQDTYRQITLLSFLKKKKVFVIEVLHSCYSKISNYVKRYIKQKVKGVYPPQLPPPNAFPK